MPLLLLVPLCTPTTHQNTATSLLQPKSYNASSLTNDLRHTPLVPHSQATIRLDTMQLSNMAFTPSLSSLDENVGEYFLSRDLDQNDPTTPGPNRGLFAQQPSSSFQASRFHDTSNSFTENPEYPHHSSTSPSTNIPGTGASTPRNAHSQSSTPFRPSGLTLLRPEKHPVDHAIAEDEAGQTSSTSTTTTTTPIAGPSHSTLAETMVPPKSIPTRLREEVANTFSSKILSWESSSPPSNTGIATEATPLMGNIPPMNYSSSSPSPTTFSKKTSYAVSSVKRMFSPQNVEDAAKTAVKSLPAVLLGSLLNILDGVSCE